MSAERRKSVPRTSQHWMVVTGSGGGEAALSRARSSAEAIVADESTR